MDVVKKNSVFIYNHQGKGNAYVKALNDAGFCNTSPQSAQVILIDIDNPGRVVKHRMNLVKARSRMFVYPHSARPSIAWDGLFSPSEYTCANFVTAEGHIDVLRAYGYSKPIHVVGWSYCPIKPFIPVKDPKNVLFAPIHPTRAGFLSNLDRQINKATFEKLIKLVDEDAINLTVRFMRGMEVNGIRKHPKVTFVQGATDLCYKEIDACDLVVSHQTFAYIAIARGKPTLMMSEETPPRNGGSEDTMKFVDSWDKYKEMLMYPLDILCADDTMGIIRRACASDTDIRDWRRRIIGEPFDARNVVQAVESYL